MTPRQIAEKLVRDYREDLISGNKPILVDMLEEAILQFMVRQGTPVPCPEHPKYSGKRSPRTLCSGCWSFYLASKS